MPERLQDRQVANLTAADLKFFKSTEQTGTGAPQNVAHGLGYVPSLVLILPTKVHLADDTWVEGTHTGTNVVVTVASGSKFVVVAL